MNVFLTSAFADQQWTHVPLVEQLCTEDRFKIHGLIKQPEQADIILYLDAHMHPGDVSLKAIRTHPIARKYPGKTFIYNELDRPWCVLPGLYVSMPARWFDPSRQSAFGYLSLSNKVVAAAKDDFEPDLLFSFMGSRTHWTRSSILEYFSTHPRGYFEDTTAINFFSYSTPDIERRKANYADVLRRSKFVLCPRGAGTSSFRLFETMAAGRVPVIIGDEWVAPSGPLWETFSVRVKESEIGSIAQRLEELEPQFAAMSVAAREAWDKWFARDVLFHRMVEKCIDIQNRTPDCIQTAKRNIHSLYHRARHLKTQMKSAWKKEEPANV